MNRALFSGVAGLKTHQAKMDVIGNNIANVNTYGFKSQRAVFSDIMYQTLRSASGGTASRGGINPSSVGYGSTLAAVQTQMTQSSMQNTGFGLDVAITGEGFFQVMDSSGNIFYTKAGLLDYDSNGYLTDINGNFVLGSSSKDGKPGTEKLRLDNVSAVSAQKPTKTQTINGVEYTLSASNATKYGNVSLTLTSSTELPAGMKAEAVISNTGAIAVKLNAYEKFSNMTELNNAINAAITEANGGKAHAAGSFTLSANKNMFGNDAVKGGFLGTATVTTPTLTPSDANQFFAGAISIKGFTPDVNASGTGAGTASFTVKKPGEGAPATASDYGITAVINGTAYTGTLSGSAAIGTTPTLKAANGGTITLNTEKSGSTLIAALDAVNGGTTASANVQLPLLGGASITAVSDSFPQSGDVQFSITGANDDGSYTLEATIGGKTFSGSVSPSGGAVTLKTGNTADGTITMSLPSAATAAKNLGLNDVKLLKEAASGLPITLAAHNYKATASKDAVSEALTGAEIAGNDFGIIPGSIEGMTNAAFGSMQFLGTSSDFAGSGTVKGNNDFYASFIKGTDGAEDAWKVTMEVGGQAYSAQISKSTLASSLLLKGPNGDYIKMSNPGFEAMSNAYKAQDAGGLEPTDGVKVFAYTEATELTVSPAEASKDLGLSEPFTLSGGTEGGAVTLDQLSNIAIGSDGTISVSHPEKGAVVVGKISLASFANPRGLAAEGSNYYSKTANSGEPKLCDPGSSGSGSLKSSALEMSNVDLSAEFADMITTQRGFQANSRIITVSDTMLEELINLKR